MVNKIFIFAVALFLAAAPFAAALEAVEIEDKSPIIIYASYWATNDTGDYVFSSLVSYDITELLRTEPAHEDIAVCVTCKHKAEAEADKGVILGKDLFFNISELLAALGF